MPTVPSNTQYRVGALPSARMQSVASPSLLSRSADVETARMGQALQNAGKTFGAMAVKMQEERNLALLAQGEVDLGNMVLEFEQAAKDRRGWAADKLIDDANKFWDETASKLMGRLENDVQRRVFREMLNKRRLASLERMANHQRSEVNQATVQTLQDGAATDISDMAAQAGNDEAVAAAAARLQNKVNAMAAFSGWGKETRDRKLMEVQTKGHEGVIDRLIEADPIAARKYYERNIKQIDGMRRDDIDRKLSVGETKAEAIQRVDSIFATIADPEERIAAAREIQDPDLHDAVLSRVKIRNAEEAAAERKYEEDRFSDAYNFAKQGGLDAIPGHVRAQLTPEQDQRLTSWFEKKVSGELKTDPAAYYELTMLAALDKNKFAQVKLGDYIDRFSPSQWQDMVDEQAKIRAELTGSAKPKGGASGDGAARSKWEMMQQAAAGAGLDPSKAHEAGEDGDKVRAFYSRLEQDAQALAGEGNTPGATEYRKAADAITLDKVFVESLGPDKQKPVSLVPAKDRDDRYVEVLGRAIYVKDIPALDRAQIVKNLNKRRLPVTEQAIASAWLRKQIMTGGKENAGIIDRGAQYTVGSPRGLVSEGNIDIRSQPRVQNVDGPASTVEPMTIGVEGGQEVLIPRVSDDGRIMTPTEAIQVFRRTGRHLGVFDSIEAANEYAAQLHEQQDSYYNQGQ